MRPESIRAAVIAAFTGVARPPDAEIAPHECDECAELRATFRSLHWQHIPAAVMERYASKLPLFSPAAYAYFLPAWLLYALDHPSHAALPTEFLVYDLAPNEARDEEHEEWRRQRLRHLTADQVAATDAVLAHLQADPAFLEYFGRVELDAGRARYRASWEQRWNS